MKSQYQGKIINFDLAPLDNNCARVRVLISVPKLQTETILEEEGLLTYLEEKYPFITDSYVRSIPSLREKLCLVEKDEKDKFQFVAYFTINTVN